MPHTAQDDINALAAIEPDILDKIFDYLRSEVDIAPARLTQLETDLRRQMGKQRQYVRSKSSREPDIADEVLRLFNGRNASEVARRLGISRATVYRHCKQPGRRKILDKGE